jgi:hypothetical protein
MTGVGAIQNGWSWPGAEWRFSLVRLWEADVRWARIERQFDPERSLATANMELGRRDPAETGGVESGGKLPQCGQRIGGPPRNWGSSGNRRWRGYVVRWIKPLSEVETESAIVDGATNLKQEVRAAS